MNRTDAAGWPVAIPDLTDDVLSRNSSEETAVEAIRRIVSENEITIVWDYLIHGGNARIHGRLFVSGPKVLVSVTSFSLIRMTPFVMRMRSPGNPAIRLIYNWFAES